MKLIEIAGIDLPIRLLKRANAKNISIRIKRDLIEVSMPKYIPYIAAQGFVKGQIPWINRQLVARESQIKWLPDSSDYKKDKKMARKLVEQKLIYWNQFYAFKWGRVAIRDQSSRWGSCSSKGNLNFNWKILHLPEELQDYIIIHELCHLEHPNHSQDFWSTVSESLPDGKLMRKKLKSYSLG